MVSLLKWTMEKEQIWTMKPKDSYWVFQVLKLFECLLLIPFQYFRHISYSLKSLKDFLLLLSRFSSVRLCATPWTAAHQLPRPWDSSGKNTGVGCHFLLQCMKVKRESEVAQSCPTLSDRMDWSPPGSSIHGIFQARVLEWGAIVISERYSC